MSYVVALRALTETILNATDDEHEQSIGVTLDLMTIDFKDGTIELKITS